MKFAMRCAGLAIMAGMAATAAHAGPILDDIKAKDKLICIVAPNSPGFSVPDSQGEFSGFNVDFCRMAAAAILGDADKAEMRGVGFSDSLKALISGSAHMASRGITQTSTRDADPGLAFVVPTFYDSQGFMVEKSLGMTSLEDLNGATICAEEGSTTLLYLADWFGAAGLDYKVENIADKTARLQAFFSGKCDAVASSVSALAADRLLAPNPDDYMLAPQGEASEPLSLVSRPDTELQKILFWGVQVMLNAEKFDITSDNIEEKLADPDSLPTDAQRLLAADGPTADMAQKLGLVPDWSVQILRQVGNYAEVFERNIGMDSPLGMDRATMANRLADDGGLMFAYPIR